MAKVPAFTELGRSAKDLLYGGREGVFQFDKLLNVTSTTSDGVDFNVRAVGRDNRLDVDLKSVYVADKCTFIATITPGGKIGVAATYKELAPGLTVGASGTLPDPDTARLAVDYSIPHLTLKSVVALTSSPKVDLSATTGHEGITAGATASYDTAKAAITKWSAGLGYTATDYQVTALLTDTQQLSLLVAHNVASDTTLGAEVVRDLSAGTNAFSVGVSRTLSGGALGKVKLENSGVLSLLYEQELRTRTKLALSAQVDALNLDKAPKYGLGLDVKY